MTRSNTDISKIKEIVERVASYDFEDMSSKDRAFIVNEAVKELEYSIQQAGKKAFESALQADKKYPVFSSPTSISYRDWLKKQIKLLSQK